MLDGSSLLPVFRGGTRPAPDILVSGFTERFRMVRIGDWKLVRVNAQQWELYNLADDPTELDDRARRRSPPPSTGWSPPITRGFARTPRSVPRFGRGAVTEDVAGAGRR